MNAKRVEGASSALVKFPEKLHVLETVRVYVRAQQIDADVHRMADEENQGKADGSHDSSAQHGSHGVDNRSDDARGQSQGQKPGVGQNVAQPAGHPVQIVGSQGHPQEPVLPAPARHQKDAGRSDDSHELRRLVQDRREVELHLGDGFKHSAGKQNQNQADKEQVPEHHVAHKIQVFLIPKQHIALHAKPQEQVDHAKQHGEHQHLHGVV